MHKHYHIYPGLRGTDASTRITHNSVRRAVTMREQVYRAVQRCGSFGATANECAEALSLCSDIVQQHIADLYRRGRITDSGYCRISLPDGEAAVVWVLSTYPHSPISEAFYGKEKTIQPAI